MARIELIMPKLGESIMEATIITWLKKPGDRIEAEEAVLEIATDKVDSEVPSPSEGVLAEILFKDGDVVPVGTVIAYLDSGAGASAAPAASAPAAQPTPQPEPAPSFGSSYTPPAPAYTPPTVIESAPVAHETGIQPDRTGLLLQQPVSGRFYSPLVLNIAREERIPNEELDRIPGTGSEGRVTKKDILAYVEQRKQGGGSATFTAPAPAAAPAAASKPAAPAQPQGRASTGYTSESNGSAPAAGMPKKSFSINGEVEIVEMDRMRKMIAENMVYSKHTSAHVTSFVEADVTSLARWRERNKSAFEKQYGEKLTFTPLFVEAVARALREFPWVNAAVDGDKIILRKDINIGLAVALPTGNLIVPIIRNADRLNLAGLARAVNDLTQRARNNQLKPDDLADGTYTLSNVGTFGNVMGTPIILQPQVAVLATGTIKKKPAVIETPEGDVIAVRQMMFLSHSYDHRIIDGAMGGAFVRRVGDLLEQCDPNRGL